MMMTMMTIKIGSGLLKSEGRVGADPAFFISNGPSKEATLKAEC